MTSAAIRLSCVCLLAILSTCSAETTGPACVPYGGRCRVAPGEPLCCPHLPNVRCVRRQCGCELYDPATNGSVTDDNCCSGDATDLDVNGTMKLFCSRGTVGTFCNNKHNCADNYDCYPPGLNGFFQGTCQLTTTTTPTTTTTTTPTTTTPTTTTTTPTTTPETTTPTTSETETTEETPEATEDPFAATPSTETPSTTPPPKGFDPLAAGAQRRQKLCDQQQTHNAASNGVLICATIITAVPLGLCAFLLYRNAVKSRRRPNGRRQSHKERTMKSR